VEVQEDKEEQVHNDLDQMKDYAYKETHQKSIAVLLHYTKEFLAYKAQELVLEDLEV